MAQLTEDDHRLIEPISTLARSMKPFVHAKSILTTIAVAFLLIGATLQSRFTPTALSQGYVAGGPASSESNVALAHAAGEFRVVIANILWLNIVDHYHHQYMAQGHSWTTDIELLPMLNLITNLDPHFVQAYEVSSAILMHLHRVNEASAMLVKASNNNPTEWVLPYDTAMMYAWYLKDPRSALPYAVKARYLATDPFYQRMVDRLVNTLTVDCTITSAPGTTHHALPQAARPSVSAYAASISS